jgi:hypothetical protein
MSLITMQQVRSCTSVSLHDADAWLCRRSCLHMLFVRHVIVVRTCLALASGRYRFVPNPEGIPVSR